MPKLCSLPSNACSTSIYLPAKIEKEEPCCLMSFLQKTFNLIADLFKKIFSCCFTSENNEKKTLSTSEVKTITAPATKDKIPEPTRHPTPTFRSSTPPPQQTFTPSTAAASVSSINIQPQQEPSPNPRVTPHKPTIVVEWKNPAESSTWELGDWLAAIRIHFANWEKYVSELPKPGQLFVPNYPGYIHLLRGFLGNTTLTLEEKTRVLSAMLEEGSQVKKYLLEDNGRLLGMTVSHNSIMDSEWLDVIFNTADLYSHPDSAQKMLKKAFYELYLQFQFTPNPVLVAQKLRILQSIVKHRQDFTLDAEIIGHLNFVLLKSNPDQHAQTIRIIQQILDKERSEPAMTSDARDRLVKGLRALEQAPEKAQICKALLERILST